MNSTDDKHSEGPERIWPFRSSTESSGKGWWESPPPPEWPHAEVLGEYRRADALTTAQRTIEELREKQARLIEMVDQWFEAAQQKRRERDEARAALAALLGDREE